MLQGVAEHDVALARSSPATIKRAFDVVFSALVLIAMLPLLLVLMLLIVIESPGNPLYRQGRVGRNGKPFRMLKLRTMVADAEHRRQEIDHLNEAQPPLFKVRRDPRVTRIGRFLRKSSLDELPQFVNVLRGEMSVVGPRPPLPAEIEFYTPQESRRLSVVPGLTGLWQVSGRSNLTWDQAVALDLEYIDHWSFLLDLRLVVRTFLVVVAGRGAY